MPVPLTASDRVVTAVVSRGTDAAGNTVTAHVLVVNNGTDAAGNAVTAHRSLTMALVDIGDDATTGTGASVSTDAARQSPELSGWPPWLLPAIVAGGACCCCLLLLGAALLCYRRRAAAHHEEVIDLNSVAMNQLPELMSARDEPTARPDAIYDHVQIPTRADYFLAEAGSPYVGATGSNADCNARRSPNARIVAQTPRCADTRIQPSTSSSESMRQQAATPYAFMPK